MSVKNPYDSYAISSDVLGSINSISSSFPTEKVGEKSFEDMLLEMLNLQKTTNNNTIMDILDNYPETDITSRINCLAKWYLNWIGNNTVDSNLNEYKSVVEVSLSENLYFTNIPFWNTIAEYLFEKFLFTPIFYLSNEVYIPRTPIIYPNLSNQGNLNYSELQDILLAFFSNSRGILNAYLFKKVQTDTTLTRQLISTNPTLRKWFGCFSPDIIYDDNNIKRNVFNPNNLSLTTAIDPSTNTTSNPAIATTVTTNNFQLTNSISEYNKSKSCDPLCFGLDKIKLVDSEGKNISCAEDVCVISNVNIEQINDNVSPNINQICPQCADKSSKCLCIVDVTVPGVLDKIDGNGISMANPGTFKQFCPNATCIQFNSITGISDIVQCPTQAKDDDTIKTLYWFEKYITINQLLFLIFSFIIMLLFLFI
jgi:hypothetical protein